jgi:hypothetical protein
MLRSAFLIGMLATYLNVMPLTVAAEPVDTNQFGFLEIGSSEREIIGRIGEPDVRTVLKKELRRSGPNTLREVVTEAWVYRGTAQIMRTVLVLENGQLLSKKKDQGQ